MRLRALGWLMLVWCFILVGLNYVVLGPLFAFAFALALIFCFLLGYWYPLGDGRRPR